MYLLRDSPVPLIDSICSAVHREEARRKRSGNTDKLDHIGLELRLYIIVMLEMMKTPDFRQDKDGNFYFLDYKVVPFIAVRVENAPEYVMFVDYKEGKVYGI